MKNLNFIFKLLLLLPFYYLMQKISFQSIQTQLQKQKLLFSFFSFFILLNVGSYAAPSSQTYVDEYDLTSSQNYTDQIHDTSKNAIVYYKFQIIEEGDVTIVVNDITTTDVGFNYSTSAYPATGGTDTNTTIHGLLAGSFIYVTVSSTQTASKNYLLTAKLSSISSDSNLTITKTNSADIITIGDDFYYTINVSNRSTDIATDVNVTDTLPSGMGFDETATNADSPNWHCTGSIGDPIIVTCENNTTGIPPSKTHTIILHVRAPLTLSNSIENNVTVEGLLGGDYTDNSASEITALTNKKDNADDLCYIENTIDKYTTEADRDAACEQNGNFYYGNGCVASVLINNSNSTYSVNNLTVTKMYAPGLDHGQIIEPISSPSISPSTLNISDYPSYPEGYIVPFTTPLTSANNVEITDENSYNNGNRMFGIILYADYNISNGVDDVDHSGRIFACSGGEGGVQILSASDVIDSPIGADAAVASYYNTSIGTSNSGDSIKYIQTMIADDDANKLVGVHLDLDGVTATQYDYTGSLRHNQTIPFRITPLWANSDCTRSYGNIEDPSGAKIVFEVPSGSYSSGERTIHVPRELVGKDYKIQMIVVDPNGLSVEGQQCLDGSTTGNFEQLAQCVNSEIQYKEAFGQSAWDRCGLDSGLPCLPTGHGEANPLDGTYDPNTDYIYLNPLGCYMCTFNIQPVCSKDNFAIRPKNFDVNITDGTIFTAGKPENLFFRAPDINNVTPLSDYNESQNSSFVIDLNVSDNSGCEIKNLSISPLVSFVNGEDNGNFTFNDIGDINMSIHETNSTEFAKVDYDDTPENLRFIEEKNATFRVIPDHFKIDANLSDHNTDGNFTYLHDINQYENDDDQYSMAAALKIDIKAVGAFPDENITHNYTEECYAKDTNLTLLLNGSDITYPGAQPLSLFLYYNSEEDNGTANSGEGNFTLPSPDDNIISIDSLPILNASSSFPSQDGPEENGTTKIAYKLNFDRKIDLLVNPFKVEVNDVNITEYNVTNIDGTLSDPSNLVKGATGSLTNQNATYYYARTKASKYFYKDIRTLSANTPITVTIYCNDTVNCDNYRFDTSGLDQDKIDERFWYLSMEHNATGGDGNVTIIIGSTLIEPVTPITSASDQAVIVDGTAYTYSSGNTGNVLIIDADDGVHNDVNITKGTTTLLTLTVPIELVQEGDAAAPPYTNEWLIYNKFFPTPPSPFYKVRFIGEASWTGEGQTGHVMDTEASYKKSQRVDW